MLRVLARLLSVPTRRFTTQRSSESSKRAGIPSFASYRFIPAIEQYLTQKQLLTPSPVQQLAFEQLLRTRPGRSAPVFLGGPTGSGKTLAYLLPLIHALKAEEEADQQVGRLPGRPRAIILAPSKELINQIHDIAKEIAHSAKLKVEKVDGSADWNRKIRDLREGVDLLVTNVDKFERLTTERRIQLSALRFLVTDEADVFIENGCEKQLVRHAKQLYLQGSEDGDVQMIYVSATLTRPLRIFLDTVYDRDVRFLLTTDTHFNLANLQHVFVPIREQNRLELLGDELAKLRGKSAEGFQLVFCNSVAAVRAVDYYLKAQGVNCSSLHSDMPVRLRAESFSNFRAKRSRVMVCSDLAARGLDFTHLTGVINFDFPRSVNDYLHRAGRAGRIGQPGTVVSLYQNKDLTLIRQLEESYQQRLPLAITQSSFALQNKEEMTKRVQQGKPARAGLPESFVEFRKGAERSHPTPKLGRSKKTYADREKPPLMKRKKDFVRSKIRDIKRGLKKQLKLTPGSKRTKYLKRELKRRHKERLGLSGSSKGKRKTKRL